MTACARSSPPGSSVHGNRHTIGVDHDAVTIDGWLLGPETRDDFARLFMQADGEAKAWAEAEAAAAAEVTSGG